MVPCQTQLFETISSNKIVADFTVSALATSKEVTKKYKSDLGSALDTIFPTQQEDTRLSRARRTLGDIAINTSDLELETHLTDFQYLVDSWLDEYERTVFDDKTLTQILREG